MLSGRISPASKVILGFLDAKSILVFAHVLQPIDQRLRYYFETDHLALEKASGMRQHAATAGYARIDAEERT